MFGHEKGAFTGAVGRRIGKYEEAHGGTLLLDEISEMDPRLQAKLLRAIQERVIDRIGGKRPVAVNIRIIATSNRDLGAAVRAGTFREDLLYRLNVVNLKIPALKDRPADILVLAHHFIAKYAAANGTEERVLSSDAQRQLAANRWPGNVRELENTMHRAVLLSSGNEIGLEAIRSPDGNRVDEMILTGNSGPAAQAAITAETVLTLVGRPHGCRCRAGLDPANPGPLPRQQNPHCQYPRHFDPYPTQQAQPILGPGRCRALPRRATVAGVLGSRSWPIPARQK